MTDWRTLFEKWDSLSPELQKQIFDAFLKKTPDQLKALFMREPYAKAIWMKIPEAVRFPPPAVPTELPTEEVERLKAFVRAKAEQLRVEWKPEVWDRFWREYEARARELWATRRVSYVEDEVEHVLRAVAPPPIAPPTPPPPIRRELTKDEVKRLEDLWSDAFFRELGRVPANALAAFRVELEKVKDKSYSEAEEHILRVARDLVAEFVARRVVERVEVPRIVVPYRPPPEEEFVAIARVPPTEPPKEPLEPEEMRFPRGPSSREREVLWNAFRYRLQEQGYNPFEYEDEFEEYIAGTQFHNWKDLLEKYEVFVSSIKAGKALPPLWLWKGMPIPVGLEGVLRKTPAERLQDVIVHFTSVVIRNARSIGKKATLEDLRKELEERALIPPDMIITPPSPLYDEVKNALTAAYKRKDVWLTGVTLEELTDFLAEV